MNNKNLEIRKEFEESGCSTIYPTRLCYHPLTDCRCRVYGGKCSCLTDTMFYSKHTLRTYDCPFYKTQAQFDDEEIIAKARWLKRVKK